MLPLVLSHQIVHPFKFWHNEQLLEGMCSGKELYCLQSNFAADCRQTAFRLATNLAEQGAQVCITCLRSEYRVWVSLRTLERVQPFESEGWLAA